MTGNYGLLYGAEFTTLTAEGEYHWRVDRLHRSGDWECVCKASPFPALRGSIQVFNRAAILAALGREG